ncbi:MAG: hypothetical protein F9K23_05560 [Bacteroidetes bacterium]|nr:MAG: hypothetical protein F9K23_05560 [Bacteroidota bacterium]
MPQKPLYSLTAFWLIVVLYVLLFMNGKEWLKQDALRHDMTSYYAYLPAVFIEDDITLNSDSARKNMYYWWSVESPQRPGRIIRMSMGVSYLHLPFFLMAHATAKPLGHATDGANAHYFFFIILGSMFYGLAGLWLLRKLLLMYHSDKVTAITLVLIAAGTNLLYYTLSEGPMSHVYNFFLIICLLYLTIKWHQKPAIGNTVLLGLVMGTITLARPLNVLLALLPVLYNVHSKDSLLQKLQLVKTRWYLVLLVCACAFLALLPQLLYWKYMSGKWMFYTYGEEGFFFTKSQVLNGLFSYRKGWWLYTPVMALATAGLFVIKKYSKEWALGLWVMLPIFVWCVYSWWSWWYGGSFGSRPMIDIYGAMALPLASLFTWALQRKWTGATFLVLGAFFVYLNGFQTWQYKKSLIHWDSMSKAVYWKVFLSKKWPDDYGDLLKHPDYEKAIKGQKEY